MGRTLRHGYTTGACAAAASAGAARMLVSGRRAGQVTVPLPAGFPVAFRLRGQDAGDDPDVTHGAAIHSEVAWDDQAHPGSITLAAGVGIGQVTKPGLAVEPGQPALLEIRKQFGDQVIDKDGRLNRPYLRSLIFSDSKARNALESILHPIIREEASRAVSQVTYAYCILVIPLLTEKGNYPGVDRILVVDVSTEVQIGRLMKRDHSSHEQAQQALASQASRKVAELHLKYLRMAATA